MSNAKRGQTTMKKDMNSFRHLRPTGGNKEAHEDRVRSLTPEEESQVWAALAHRVHGFPAEGQDQDLWTAMRVHDLGAADVVYALARSTNPDAIRAVSKICGREIDRRTPLPSVSSGRRAPSTRARKSDPRKILKVAPNPKKPGSASHARYALYEVGITVDEAMRRGVTRADIAHDTSRGFISLEG